MSKAKTYCKAYGIPLIIAFYLLLLAEAPNTVSVTSQNPHPNEVLNELNGYASLGWTFKNIWMAI